MKKNKKKKKKGFTLVELIAVIAILAVIITVAGISIVAIKKNVLEKERKNLQSEIKAAAQSYHDETGIDTVPIGLLLQIGALQADTTEYEQGDYQLGDPVILDPVDGEPINCDAITFDNEGNAEYEYNIGCSAETLSQIGLQVLYKTTNMKNANLYNENWIALEDNEKLTLSIYNPDSSVEYEWINLLAPDKSQTGKTIEIEIPEDKLINAQYRVEATINGVQSSTDFVLKVDAKVPTIENEYMTQELEWATNKDMVAIITDDESTIAGYYLINLDKETKCPTVDSSKWQTAGLDLTNGTSNYNFDINITENGTYSVCAKDVAGHVTMASSSYTEENIDSTAPTVTLATETNKTTYTKTKTATVTITDEGAGFDGSTMKVKYGWSNAASVSCSNLTNTLNIPTTAGSNTASANITINDPSYTGAGKIYICTIDGGIKDRLGNTTNKNEKLSDDMYLDNTAPKINSITIASTQSSYNSAKVNVTLNGISDANVGMGSVCLSTSNNSSGCTWKTIESTDTQYTFTDFNAGTDGSGSKITLYAFAKDTLGNVMTTPTTNTYTIYAYCTNTYISGYGEYGSCSKKCDGGTKYRDVYYKDEYFREHTCPTKYSGDSASCNTFECCTSTTIKYTDGSSCTAECDGGTYNQLAYSTYDSGYSIRCSSYDKTSGGSACNTQACCTTSEWKYSSCSSKGYKVYTRTTTCPNTSTSYTSSEACESTYTYSDCGSCSSSCGWGTCTKTCTYYKGGTKYTCSSTSADCYSDCPPKCYLYVKNSGNTFTAYWNSACQGTGSTTTANYGTVYGTSKYNDKASNYVCYRNKKGYYGCTGGTKFSGCGSSGYCAI